MSGSSIYGRVPTYLNGVEGEHGFIIDWASRIDEAPPRVVGSVVEGVLCQRRWRTIHSSTVIVCHCGGRRVERGQDIVSLLPVKIDAGRTL